jgi:hypothetical protein
VFYNDTGNEEAAREEIEYIRSEVRFNPDKVGQDEALQNTKQYFEENEFHLRYTGFGLTSFLTEEFPWGARPCDLIKWLRVYVHCENFAEWVTWQYDQENEDQEIPDENHPWPERQDLVYESVFDEGNRLASVPFATRPHLTIVILLDFRTPGWDFLDEDRIYSNFSEAWLQAYHVLKPQCETMAVVHSSLFDLVVAEPKEEHRYDNDVTPHMELADSEFAQVCLQRFF